MSSNRTRPGVYALITISASALLFAVIPSFAFAGEGGFVPLVGIPGIDVSRVNLVGYLNALYILCISIGALFAVVKIGVAGAKYSMSDIITDKESAKKDIYGALLGLAILLATYVVLYTIDPRLTNLNILGNARPGAITAPAPAPGTGGAGSTATGGAVQNTSPLAPKSDTSIKLWTSSKTCYNDACKAACTGPNQKLETYASGATVCNSDTIIRGSTEGSVGPGGRVSGFDPTG